MADILSKLAPPAGSRKKAKRVARGPGSGLGKTAGRGGKGQTARSGGKVGRGFEGGQMPAQRRMPKRGFTNIFKKDIVVVNVGSLEVFDNGSVVDPAALLARGILKKLGDGVKVLGNGDLTKKLTVRLDATSVKALEKIVNAGGVFEPLRSGLTMSKAD